MLLFANDFAKVPAWSCARLLISHCVGEGSDWTGAHMGHLGVNVSLEGQRVRKYSHPEMGGGGRVSQKQQISSVLSRHISWESFSVSDERPVLETRHPRAPR